MNILIHFASIPGDTGAPGGGFECMYIVFFVFPMAAFLLAVFVYIAATLAAGAALGFAGAAAGVLAGLVCAAVAYIAALAWGAAAVFMSRRPSYIKPIRRRPPPPPEITGNKGASLFQILNEGLDTPRGFVICTPAFRQVTREPAAGPPEAVHWPVRMMALKRALGSHFHPDEKVIVRSSFFGEDSAGASFAGAYDSVKDVPARDANAVVEAAIRVYSSYWSERAEIYRSGGGQNKGKTGGDAPAPLPKPVAAVVVQLQVDHEWSGVAFSLNPHTGYREEFIVEAKKAGAEKNYVYIFNRMTGMWRSPAPEECPALPLLEAALPRLETAQGLPVQIEWGMSGETFHVLQCRPAVGVPEVKTYTNSYVVDTPPYPLTPLSLSVLEKIPSGFEDMLPGGGAGTIWSEFGGRLYVDYALVRRATGISGLRAVKMLLSAMRRAGEKSGARIPDPGDANKDLNIEKTVGSAVWNAICGFLSGQAAAVTVYAACDAALKWLYAPEYPPAPQGTGESFGGEISDIDPETAEELLDLDEEKWLAAARGVATGDEHIEIETDGLSGRAAAAFWNLIETNVSQSAMPLELSPRRNDRNPALAALRARQAVRNTLKKSLAGPLKMPPSDPDFMLQWKKPAAKFLLSIRNRMNTRRETLRAEIEKGFTALSGAAHTTGAEFTARGIIEYPEDVFYLTLGEITGPMSVVQVAAAQIPERKKLYETALEKTAPPVIHVLDGEVIDENPERDETAPAGAVLAGTGNGRGTARGAALVQNKPEFKNPELMKGVILIAPAATPEWIPWLPHVEGVVFETGAALSHVMLAAAEKGIPAVAGVPDATSKIETGMTIELNSATGEVTIMEE